MEATNNDFKPGNGFPIGRDQAAKAAAQPAPAETATPKKIAEIVQPAVSKVVGGLSQGVNVVQGVVISGVAVASDMLCEKQDRLLEDTRLLVTAKPITALGVAFGAGILLSILLSRR